jgi:ParB family transcriptional regulator, chromosome partitioning protein
MANVVQKIKLSLSRDISFNKLVLSQSNVRRIKAGISIAQLAESIAQHTLLQSLSVRAVVDADGRETGMFEVPAGDRRYRALELLVKQKRMAKTNRCPAWLGMTALPRTTPSLKMMSASACIRLISFVRSRFSVTAA